MVADARGAGWLHAGFRRQGAGSCSKAHRLSNAGRGGNPFDEADAGKFETVTPAEEDPSEDVPF
jgi:hypothetical protein